MGQLEPSYNTGVNEISITWKTGIPNKFHNHVNSKKCICVHICENKYVHMLMYVHSQVCACKKYLYKNAKIFIKALFLLAKPQSISSRTDK